MNKLDLFTLTTYAYTVIFFRESRTIKVVGLRASYAVFIIRISVAICALASFFVVGVSQEEGYLVVVLSPNTVSMAF